MTNPQNYYGTYDYRKGLIAFRPYSDYPDHYIHINNVEKDLKILDSPQKPYEKLKWSDGKILDLHKYMTEHIYMYSSENVRVKFRITKPLISDVIDMLGKDISFWDETDTYVTVTANVNEMSMHQFAKSYAPDLVVLEPQSLADKIKADLKKSLDNYGK